MQVRTPSGQTLLLTSQPRSGGGPALVLSSGMTLVTSATGSASTMAPSSSAVLTSVTPALQAKVLPQQLQGDDAVLPFTCFVSFDCLIPQ